MASRNIPTVPETSVAVLPYSSSDVRGRCTHSRVRTFAAVAPSKELKHSSSAIETPEARTPEIAI